MLRKNHVLTLSSTNRMGEESGRNWEGYKSWKYANWRVQINRVLPDCQQLIIAVDRDHLITAVLVALKEYLYWKHTHSEEWED